MGRIIQEKLQYELKDQSHEDDAHTWVSDSSARVKKGTPSGSSVFLNSLPSGMDITDQEMSDILEMPLVTSGTTDYTVDVAAKSLRDGFSRKHLEATDGVSESTAGFYDEVEVDGVTGFCERRNVMDRT